MITANPPSFGILPLLGGTLLITLDNGRNPLVALRNLLPFSLLRRLGLVPYYVGPTLGPTQLIDYLRAAGFAVSPIPGPCALIAADFNTDDWTDLAVANCSSGTISILLNNQGSGGLLIAQEFRAGNYPTSIAAQDLNGDNTPDLAVVNNGNNTVQVFLNNLK